MKKIFASKSNLWASILLFISVALWIYYGTVVNGLKSTQELDPVGRILVGGFLVQFAMVVYIIATVASIIAAILSITSFRNYRSKTNAERIKILIVGGLAMALLIRLVIDSSISL